MKRIPMNVMVTEARSRLPFPNPESRIQNPKSIAALLICCLLTSATSAHAARLKVLTTFLPVYCFTANVAGDQADVENLLPAGVSPHEFSFLPREARKVGTADLIIVNGLAMEPWLDKMLKANFAAQTPPVIEATAGIRPRLIAASPDRHPGSNPGLHQPRGGANPHVWLDPTLAAHAVTNILLALSRADPSHASAYELNARNYLARLQALDSEIATALAPIQNRSIVTYHDAFPYFARRYGLDVVGVIEEIPEVNPSPRYLSELGRRIRTNDVRVIFTEAGPPSKLAKQIADDLHTALAPLDTLETGRLAPGAYEEGMRSHLRILLRFL